MDREQRIDSELRRVGKNTALYSIGNVGVKIVTFLLIPVYTHYLSVYEVGVIILLELLEVLYGYIAPLGVLNGLFRFFFAARKEGNEKRFLASNFFFMMGVNAILLVGLVTTSSFSARILLSDEGLTTLVQVYYVSLYLGLTRVFLLNLFRIYEKPLQFIATVFGYFLLIMSFNVWFVVGKDMGLWGVVWARLITSGLIFLVAGVILLREFGIEYEHSQVVRSLSYGMPMIFHGISVLIISMSDRYLIKELISVEASGIYGIANKFGMIMNMVLVTPFIQAWQPVLFRLEHRPEQKLTYQKTALHFVQIGMLLWLAVSIGGKYLIRWTTTPSYYEGIILVPFVAFSYFLYGLQDIFKAGALLNNLTIRVTLLGMTAAGSNILLNVLLIPPMGLLGAAIVKVISYFLLLVFILNLSQKHFYIRWLWKKMVLIILLGVAFYLPSLIFFQRPVLTFLKDGSVILLLPFAMILMRLVSLSEVSRFLSHLRKG